MKNRISLAIALLAMLAGGAVHAQGKFCGDLRTQFGPFDYRKAASLPFEIHIVEIAHFTPNVENNIKGESSWIGGDLSYTLVVWPNHHRALASMSRQGIIEKKMQAQGAKYPVDCYFLRAFQFAPDDGMAHAIYGNHMFAHGKTEEALREFKRAVELEPENPTINYNAGLAYLNSKDYDMAVMHAKKAYAREFPLPGLKNKLIAAGKWDGKVDKEVAAPAEPAIPAATAASAAPAVH
jgi:tetratricopeptide (TPR) repeat protein